MKRQKMITKEEIDAVWGNASFGSMTKEEVVKYGLLKCASGWYQGYTSTMILTDLGLITKKYNVTARGRWCLYEYFKGKRNP